MFLYLSDTDDCGVLEKTLKNLRTKKIRKNRERRKTEKKDLARKEIRDIIASAREEGTIGQFYSKSGKISIKPVTQSLPKSLKMCFSAKQLRRIIDDMMKK